jgi:hypothetical protein
MEIDQRSISSSGIDRIKYLQTSAFLSERSMRSINCGVLPRLCRDEESLESRSARPSSIPNQASEDSYYAYAHSHVEGIMQGQDEGVALE